MGSSMVAAMVQSDRKLAEKMVDWSVDMKVVS